MKYSLENLKKQNLSYNEEHTLIVNDVEKINNWVEFIESSLKNKIPKVGDIVEFTDNGGVFYKNAHIEKIYEDKMYICECPYTPFIYKTKNGQNNVLATSTSGGAWTYIPKNLKHIGTREKLFADWGHCGCCGNGAINFTAKVNVWQYIAGDHKFTTENYDKFILFINKKDDKCEYVVSSFGSNHYFESLKQYKAWLKTFKGEESQEGKIIWTYKQLEKCIPLEEYLEIKDCIIDTTLCNGCIQECKRKYVGTTVITYLPYQHNIIKKEGKEYQYAYKQLGY